jgi:hypothetical protein
VSLFSDYPTYLIDGHLNSWHGSPQWDYWDDDTDLRLAVATDVTIDLEAAPGAVTGDYDVTARVCIEAGGTGDTMRVYIAEILDGYPKDALSFTRNGLRQVAPTEDIVLAADECTDVLRTLTLDADSLADIDSVSFVAWAQDDLAAGPAEVFQAGVVHHPFSTDLVFADGFESMDASAWSLTVP